MLLNQAPISQKSSSIPIFAASMLLLSSILALILISVFVFLRKPQFGKRPRGTRLATILQSPNYKNGSFQNLHYTPSLTDGATFWTVLSEYLFKKKPEMRPKALVPSIKTDLHNLAPKENILVWFGHSSYFLQVDGKCILVDPVLSGSASPLPYGTQSFKGTDRYTPEDFPEIDLLFLSHDHWDHLDYKTIKQLKPKIKKVITGLGTGEHLEYWGFNKTIIIEKDWNEDIQLSDGFSVHTTPARHFSGRGFKRNKALWLSFVFQTPSLKIFLGGDSGYDTHFAEIGAQFGPFDLAILENGQYDHKWRHIHMLPEEILTAAKELKAKRILPVHSSKFVLSNHSWKEPLEQIVKNNEQEKLNIITPMIGEKVDLSNSEQHFIKWWEKL